MNKLEMAHEYLLRFSGATVADAWAYVDAMQAEADKRENKETCNKSLNIDSKELNVEEWQPDWSLSPDGYDWFAVDKNGTAYFFTYKPETIESEEYWADFTGISSNGTALESDSSFGYTGDWRDSLRKRPQ